jgi:hypothetical protein
MDAVAFAVFDFADTFRQVFFQFLFSFQCRMGIRLA